MLCRGTVGLSSSCGNKNKVLLAQSCPTLLTPWTVACQASLSMEFSRQQYWSGLPFPSPGDFPDPGIKPVSPVSPTVAGRFFITYRRLSGRFFITEPPGKPLRSKSGVLIRWDWRLLQKEEEKSLHTFAHTEGRCYLLN